MMKRHAASRCRLRVTRQKVRKSAKFFRNYSRQARQACRAIKPASVSKLQGNPTVERDAISATQLLQRVEAGQSSALGPLIEVVYHDLHQLASRFLRREIPNHTLQPTALVHEVFLKLIDQRQVSWQGRTHFLAIGAQAMRRILVDHARSRSRSKRGGARQRMELTEDVAISTQRDADVEAVDDALQKLAQLDPRQASIVELRFFGGMTMDEVAQILGVSKRTVEAEWTMIRAWLRRELAESDDTTDGPDR